MYTYCLVLVTSQMIYYCYEYFVYLQYEVGQHSSESSRVTTDCTLILSNINTESLFVSPRLNCLKLSVNLKFSLHIVLSAVLSVAAV